MENVKRFMSFTNRLKEKTQPYSNMMREYQGRLDKELKYQYSDGDLVAEIDKKLDTLNQIWACAPMPRVSVTLKNMCNFNDEKFLKSMLEKINKKYDGKFEYGEIETLCHFETVDYGYDDDIDDDEPEYGMGSKFVKVNAIYDTKLTDDLKKTKTGDEDMLWNTIARYSNQGRLFIIPDEKEDQVTGEGYAGERVIGRHLSVHNDWHGSPENFGFWLSCESFGYSGAKAAIDPLQKGFDQKQSDKNNSMVLKSYLETVDERMPKLVSPDFYINAREWFKTAEAKTQKQFQLGDDMPFYLKW
jgi:hypothetical protein